MPWTTRQPKYDVETLFPFLKGRARTAMRLHPCREVDLPPTVSKIGGAFVWPPSEQPPICPTTSCPAIPVLQIRRSEFPLIKFPGDTDLMQLLWYPRAYEDWNYGPKIEMFWRTLGDMPTDSVLQPVYKHHADMFFIHECRLEPEVVLEYPYIGLLTEVEQQAISKWEEEQDDPLALYQYCLSTSPGSKVGGYPEYGGQDAPAIFNSDGKESEYLLTLADWEWDGASFPRWRPIEQRFPPGRRVEEKLPNGGTRVYTKYTPEEELELESWTPEEWSRYRARQEPLGAYLPLPMNVFLDKSTDPWRWKMA